MNLDAIHWPAVVAAAASTFVVGGVWYSPAVFGRAWQRANGFTETGLKPSSTLRTFGGGAVCAVLMATSLACWLAALETDWPRGALVGGLVGGGWVAADLGLTALFEQRPWSYLVINGGYHVVSFVVMGAILGGWR